MSQCHTLLIFTKLQRQKSVIKTGKSSSSWKQYSNKNLFCRCRMAADTFCPFTAISRENLTFLIANVGPLLTKRF